MNKLSFVVLFLLCASLSYAKIWRVNNNIGVSADFTTLQAAHDGASPGDTLHLEASPNSYGNLYCSKKIIIIGPGYFLDQNPDLQADVRSAIVGGINFNDGSAGSIVMGLDFNYSSISVFSDDIVVKRNKFSRNYTDITDYYTGAINIYYAQNNGSIPANNIIISQNYGLTINVQYPSTGILINNNYIAVPGYAGDATTSQCLSFDENAVVLVQNNILRRGKITAYNSSFTNNIMYAGSFEGTGNLTSNNVANSTQFGSANGNKQNVDMSTVFVASGSSDGYWKLKAGSPAIGAGYGSTPQNPVDAGIYSGYSPYVLSGIPPVPSVYSFTNQPVGSTNDPIDVTIKVRSNN